MAAALQQSGPRHHTGFFAASSFRTLKRPVSSTSGIGEVVKIIILDLTLSLSVLCQYCYQAYIKLKTGVSRKIICAVIAELEPLFSTEYSMNDSQTMVIHSWGSGKHFLKNELKLSLQGKQLVVVAMIKFKLSGEN